MEILRWEVLALVIAVVGLCEASKKMGLKFPTVLVSLVFSILAGILASPFVLRDLAVPAWQASAICSLLVYGAATLSYESVLKRFGHNDKP